MYGLPPHFDASVFVGRTLDLICFSTNTMDISFEGNVSITVMGSFSYQRSPSEPAIKQSLPVMSSDLMGLLGKEVLRAEGSIDGMLSLEFADQHVVTFLDDVPNYEAYIIRIGEREIIV